jgi:cell division FtsZ-interacting protein ZapD
MCQKHPTTTAAAGNRSLQSTLHATGRSDTEESLLKTLEKQQQQQDVVESKDDVEKQELQKTKLRTLPRPVTEHPKKFLYVAL